MQTIDMVKVSKENKEKKKKDKELVLIDNLYDHTVSKMMNGCIVV